MNKGILLFDLQDATITDITAYIAHRYSIDPKGIRAVEHLVPLTKILAYARRIDWAFEPTILEPGINATVRFTPQNAVWLMANSFLGNVRSNSLHWKLLFMSSNQMAHERLKCICDYFEKFDPTDEGRVIEISRIVSDPIFPPLDTIITTDHVVMHTNSMESKPEAAFVDFTNQDLHIHKIIASCTQEEVLFSMCSECFIALHIVPTLRDDEAVVFRNVWRHSDYTGYAESFKWQPRGGGYRIITNIIAIDATVFDQFGLVERDLKKAILGFDGVPNAAISTGKWGCGAFGGDIHLKFIQQLIAAQLTKKTLYYSSFNNDDEAESYFKLTQLIDAKKPTLRWMLNSIRNFPYQHGFHKYICEGLKGI